MSYKKSARLINMQSGHPVDYRLFYSSIAIVLSPFFFALRQEHPLHRHLFLFFSFLFARKKPVHVQTELFELDSFVGMNYFYNFFSSKCSFKKLSKYINSLFAQPSNLSGRYIFIRIFDALQ